MTKPPSRIIVGLMSGTSVDAIDAAVVRIHGPASAIRRVQTLHHLARPWPPQLRARLLAVMAPADTSTQEICELNALVAREFAAAANHAIAAAHIAKSRITALGSHGQTICHLPPENSPGKKRISRFPSTLQLGDPSVIAALTGITTVGNFRPADMALGGQGAPLVPWTDAALLRDPKITRCVQNIGGIANVTYLPPINRSRIGSRDNTVLAFDTGPGNMLMDAVINLATVGRQHFDRNGQLAQRGAIDPALFHVLRQHPYFRRPPPKSTGREAFGAALATQIFEQYRIHRQGRLENLLATLTHLTAWSIIAAYVNYLPKLPQEIILCGGGADNPTLVAMLADQLMTLKSPHPIRLRRIDEFGIPNKAKEAVSFALLALATLDGTPGNLPSVTGARQKTILGVIARPAK